MQITPISRTVGQDRVRVPPSSVHPKVLEPVGCHVGVPDGVLNVLVPEIVLQSPRVVAIVGELEPTGMAKHVRVDWNGILAASPSRWTSRWKPMGLIGPPRSETNTWASLGSSRRSLRSARISSPRIGWTLGIPFFTR